MGVGTERGERRVHVWALRRRSRPLTHVRSRPAMESVPAAPAMATNATTGAIAYDVPADTIWPVVSSWSGSWLTKDNSPAAVKDAQGPADMPDDLRRIGATRKVYMLDGSGEWGEEITSIDEESMCWTYKLTSALPAPFDGIDAATFACTMSVVAKGDGCEVMISAAPVPAPMVPMMTGMYTAWTKSMADKSSPGAAKIAELQATIKHLQEENLELQELCIETQKRLNEEAPKQAQRDQELEELTQLCISTQAQLNDDMIKQERRDQELKELQQLCIETQANLNKQLDTPEAKKDEELAELRELCIQTQAKLCEDAVDVDGLRAQLAKKDEELAELMALCVETQRKLNEDVAQAEEGTPPEPTSA